LKTETTLYSKAPYKTNYKKSNKEVDEGNDGSDGINSSIFNATQTHTKFAWKEKVKAKRPKSEFFITDYGNNNTTAELNEDKQNKIFLKTEFK